MNTALLPYLRRLLRAAPALTLALGLAAPGRAASPADLPETCYLFSYFYHDEAAEGLRLAWSRDGFAFEALNGTRSYLRPSVGEEKLLRDPSLLRAADGRFHLVWTTGWNGRTIGYAWSDDLIHWSEQRALPVMMHEPDAQNCWAPELVWDPAARHYVIAWSTTILGRYPETEMSNRRPDRNHRIYATTTTDFVTYTPTQLIYEAGYNVIDAAFLPDEAGGWLMFVKDETFAPVTQKNIRMVRGRTPLGPFGPVSPPLTGNYWAEGPSPIRVGDEWRVYFDKHMLNSIGLVCSRDLVTWEDVSDRVAAPVNARHGSVLAVPRAVIETLLRHGENVR